MPDGKRALVKRYASPLRHTIFVAAIPLPLFGIHGRDATFRSLPCLLFLLVLR